MSRVRLEAMIEVIHATHLSSYVEGPFRDRGGLFLVGDPALFKTAMLDVLDRHYYNALALTDLNTRSLVDLRGQIGSETIRTLVLSELAKLYERDPRTAANLEGNLRAMAAEGFKGAGFEDARINRVVARCTIIAAVTPALQEEHFQRWEKSGFSRRFIWPLVSGLDDPEAIDKAVEKWELIPLGEGPFPPIPDGPIPNMTSAAERSQLRVMLKYQPGGNHATQTVVLTRTLAVLKWWYKRTGRSQNKAMQTIREFANTLQRGGAKLVLPKGGR